MGATADRQALVELADIRAAVRALEDAAAAGLINQAEASKRINDCRRAVTPRELWKASGGRAGSKKRSDWWDIRKTVFGATFLLVLAVLGVWMVTVLTGSYVGDGGYIPDVTPPGVSVPSDDPPG